MSSHVTAHLLRVALVTGHREATGNNVIQSITTTATTPARASGDRKFTRKTYKRGQERAQLGESPCGCHNVWRKTHIHPHDWSPSNRLGSLTKQWVANQHFYDFNTGHVMVCVC